MSVQQENTGDTGNGMLVGNFTPAQPRLASDWGGTPRPDQDVTQQRPAPQQQQPTQEERPAYRWTDEDLERVRTQEKDKLYGRINDMDTQLRALAEEREAEKVARQAEAEAAEAARRAEEEGKMEVRDLLERREKEFQAQINEINQRYETDRAVFQRERELAEAELYRRDRIAQESEYILPELRDFITGSTVVEIDASIETMKARTEAILQNLASVEPPPVPFQQRMGAAPTAPPVGPMEQLPSYESLTPEMIKGMDMDTYKRYRNELLQASSRAGKLS